MRTRMHQEAFPGEDISDRPPPEESVPGLLELIDGELPSGRYQARASLAGRRRGASMSALAFELPPRLEATEPPEQRGLARDGVRLMVADAPTTAARSRPLPRAAGAAAPGDLWSSTSRRRCPPRSPGRRAATARPVRVHFATRAPELDERWRVVELRSADGSHPARGRAGETIDARRRRAPSSSWSRPYALGVAAAARAAAPARARRVPELLGRHGEPIRYGYVARRWPLDAYQNVYATTPGSAEMPSAGRPFTAELIDRAGRRAGSRWRRSLCTPASPRPSATSPRSPSSTRSRETTARLVNATRAAGGRVIAVGTTVVRALETVVGDDGDVAAGAGWTDLVIEPDRGVGAVDGLITGWHEPEASHLMMLEAIGGAELLRALLRAALRRGYLWHEFGDSHLILR